MSKIYPDISHHHPVSDWTKIKKNCPFIITKATQGKTFVDSAMSGIIKQCESRKIPYWLYVYLNKGDELEQTRFMVKTCKDKVGDYFVGYILDVEAGNTAVGVQEALEYLATTGKTMLYTMYAEYDRYKTVIKNRPDNCAWWEARYGLNNGSYNSKYPCHSDVDLHQYTSAGTCPGIPDKIDLNRITGANSKKESWFLSAADSGSAKAKTQEVDYAKERVDDVKYFSTIKNKAVSGITEFLHNRGIGAGKPNLSKIAAANCQSDEVKAALFALAKKGLLIKPEGLNKWEKK